MNINRHNYEEYFLLYVDDELTAAERVLVETFIEANPDLKEELDILQQTTFHIDAKLDEGFKSKLLKQESVSEEQLMLLLDGELRKEEALKIQEAIVADAQLQKDWAWLQRSKLTADTNVTFPDKSLLYKEAQPARLFYMSTAVRRWSAAAAVLLMLGTGYWLYNQQTVTGTVAGVGTEKPSQQPGVITKPSINNLEDTTETNEVIAQEPKKSEQTISVTPTPVVKQNNIKQPISAPLQNNTAAVSNQPKQEQKVVVPQPENNLQVQEAIVKTESKPEVTRNNSTTSAVPSVTNIAASSVSYVNNDEQSEEDEQEGLLNESKQRSTGLKALIKKAKRTLERRTGIQSGESQVRFAVFAVNTQ